MVKMAQGILKVLNLVERSWDKKKLRYMLSVSEAIKEAKLGEFEAKAVEVLLDEPGRLSGKLGESNNWFTARQLAEWVLRRHGIKEGRE